MWHFLVLRARADFPGRIRDQVHDPYLQRLRSAALAAQPCFAKAPSDDIADVQLSTLLADLPCKLRRWAPLILANTNNDNNDDVDVAGQQRRTQLAHLLYWLDKVLKSMTACGTESRVTGAGGGWQHRSDRMIHCLRSVMNMKSAPFSKTRL